MRRPVRSGKAVILMVMVSSVLAAGCRSERRGVKVAAPEFELKVTMNGLAKEHENKSGWIYELSGCVEALSGNLQDGNAVAFKSAGLKRGLTGCAFRVRVAEVPQSMRFIAGSEANVPYSDLNMTIVTDAQGALVSTANLQKFVNIIEGDARSSITVEVPAVFPDEPVGTNITGSLVCSPQLISVGAYKADGSKKAVFTFLPVVDRATAFKCTALYVHIDSGLQRYRADLSAIPLTINADPAVADPVKVAAITLVATEQAKPAPRGEEPLGTSGRVATEPGIDVSTTNAGKCPEGQTFVVDEHKCK